MTIDKAIEILPIIIKTLPVTLGESEKDAIKLGIEALKALEVYRSANESWLSLLLPGETTEEETKEVTHEQSNQSRVPGLRRAR